jgi:LPXTG-motif cell wall-anchored protein
MELALVERRPDLDRWFRSPVAASRARGPKLAPGVYDMSVDLTRSDRRGRARRWHGVFAGALAAALVVGTIGSTEAYAQVPGASYGEGPGATGVRPGVAATGPGRPGAEGPALVEARQLPRTGDGSMTSDDRLDSTVPVAAAGGVALLGGLAAVFAFRRRKSTVH